MGDRFFEDFYATWVTSTTQDSPDTYGVLRFTATGDLLFFKSTSGTECDDFSTFPTPPFPFIVTETGVITGGTGAYSGATGTFTVKVKGASLSLDASGVRAFGWFKVPV